MQLRQSLLLGAAVLALSAGIVPQISQANGFESLDWIGAIIRSADKTDGLIHMAEKEMAKSQEVTVRNQYQNARKFYWTAAGCAGVANGVTFVCKSEEVPANGEARYRFKGGTSQRHVEVKGIDGKDKSCHHKFDVNTSGGIRDLTVPFECAGVIPPKSPGQSSAPIGLVLNINVTSQREKAVTVIVGHKNCSRKFMSLNNVCDAIEVPAKGNGTLSYSIIESPPTGMSYYLTGGGVVTWTDGSTASQPAELFRDRKSVV